MIKKISVLLAFVAFLFCDLALAQGYAIITSVVGTANVQTGSGTPRALRMGDQVLQGDTVSTGANSSLVMKFEDGEVAALTQNSRMTITAYQYEAASGRGNMLLSLVTGGMRAITGLLGRNQPERVAYRAATATIGIRGTDVTIATDGDDVEVTVNDGSVTLTVNGKSVTLTKGQTYYVHNGALSATKPAGFSGQVDADWSSMVSETVSENGLAIGFTSGNVQYGVTSGGSGGSVSPH